MPRPHLLMGGWKFGASRGPHSSSCAAALGGLGAVEPQAVLVRRVQNWLAGDKLPPAQPFPGHFILVHCLHSGSTDILAQRPLFSVTVYDLCSLMLKAQGVGGHPAVS